MLNQLAIGSALIVITVLVHATCIELILKVMLAIKKEIYVRWRVVTFAVLILAIFAAHMIEIWVWAVFFFFIEEISTFEAALYFSTSSFTTVGFGDITLTEEWRLLSSLEATNGMILFGWSTAFIFAVIRGIYDHHYRGVEAYSSS